MPGFTVNVVAWVVAQLKFTNWPGPATVGETVKVLMVGASPVPPPPVPPPPPLPPLPPLPLPPLEELPDPPPHAVKSISRKRPSRDAAIFNRNIDDLYPRPVATAIFCPEQNHFQMGVC